MVVVIVMLMRVQLLGGVVGGADDVGVCGGNSCYGGCCRGCFGGFEHSKDTSLAASWHSLTACKIQNGFPGSHKWLTGSEREFNPRL